MRRVLLAAILAVTVLGLPALIGQTYYMRLINLGLVFGVLAISLNIVLGYAGQISLAHGAFLGIGAYAAALITAGQSGLLFWPGFLAAGAVTGLFGLAIGIPTLRLRGHYLALATLGFGEIVRIILFNWREVTHGMDGISAIPAPSLGFVVLDNDWKFYYLAAAVLGLALAASQRLQGSKFGRELAAIRDAELAARTCGVNVTRLKILAFGLSAVLAGFAGSLYAHLVGFISPDAFGFEVTASTLSMVLVGGIGTSLGPVLGSAILTALPEVLRASKAYYMLLYGVGIAATGSARQEEAEIVASAQAALAFVGLEDHADRLIGTLPHEQQRLVEIARALALRPRVLMLDEPAAGMNPSEAERLIERILRLRDFGITILLVEHNMPLVMRIADYVTVLNFGRKIAEGTPAEIRGERQVVEAYLGKRMSRQLGNNEAA